MRSDQREVVLSWPLQLGKCPLVLSRLDQNETVKADPYFFPFVTENVLKHSRPFHHPRKEENAHHKWMMVFSCTNCLKKHWGGKNKNIMFPSKS